MDGGIMFFKDNKRNIPKKNYIYLFLIILFSLMVIYYVYMWHKSYKESLLNTDILSDYLNVINYNEIDDYIVENKDAVIYVSILGDEVINRFEMNFRNAIRDNDLRSVLLYLNVSEFDKSVIDEKFGTDCSYPYLVVYTGGKVTDVYDIKKNNYKSKKIVKYLNRIGVMEND